MGGSPERFQDVIDAYFTGWQLARMENDPEKLRTTEELLYKTMRDYAEAIIWNHLGIKDDDLTQTAISRAFENVHKFRGLSTFGTWYFRVVFNTAQRYLRDRQRHPEVHYEDLVGAYDDRYDPPDRLHEADWVKPTMAKIRKQLTVEDYQFLVDKLQGDDLNELAKTYGLKPSGVRERWATIQKRVKTILGVLNVPKAAPAVDPSHAPETPEE